MLQLSIDIFMESQHQIKVSSLLSKNQRTELPFDVHDSIVENILLKVIDTQRFIKQRNLEVVSSILSFSGGIEN